MELYRLNDLAEPAPAAPSSLTATAASPGVIDLSWTDAAANEPSYRVERSASADFSAAQLLAVLPAGITAYTDKTVEAGTTYYYRVYAHNAGGASSPATGSATTGPAPAVAEVDMSASTWSAGFLKFLRDAGAGKSGYTVTGNNARPLPWLNLNQVAVRFNRPVAVHQTDLHVRGATVPQYGVSDFHYDPDTRTGVWTLSAPIGADKVVVELDAAKFAAEPLRLDGLPGDVNRDGSVLADDYSQIKRQFFAGTTNPGSGLNAYSVFSDINGSGIILADDYSEVRK